MWRRGTIWGVLPCTIVGCTYPKKDLRRKTAEAEVPQRTKKESWMHRSRTSLRRMGNLGARGIGVTTPAEAQPPWRRGICALLRTLGENLPSVFPTHEFSSPPYLMDSSLLVRCYVFDHRNWLLL